MRQLFFKQAFHGMTEFLPVRVITVLSRGFYHTWGLTAEISNK